MYMAHDHGNSLLGAKSRPRNNKSEHSDLLPCHLTICFCLCWTTCSKCCDIQILYFSVATQQVSCSSWNKVLQGTSQALSTIIVLREKAETSQGQWKERVWSCLIVEFLLGDLTRISRRHWEQPLKPGKVIFLLIYNNGMIHLLQTHAFSFCHCEINTAIWKMDDISKVLLVRVLKL